MRPHEWLGVEHVPAPRGDRRPVAYIASSAVALLAALTVLRAIPGEPVAVQLTVPAPGRVVAVALVHVDGAAAAPTVAAPPVAPVAPTVALALDDVPDEPAPRGRAARRVDRSDPEPGILGAPGLATGIARVTGSRDLAAGMAEVERGAGPGPFEPVEADGCGARCFGGSRRAAKRDCVFGEHLDDHGRCVPDEAR